MPTTSRNDGLCYAATIEIEQKCKKNTTAISVDGNSVRSCFCGKFEVTGRCWWTTPDSTDFCARLRRRRHLRRRAIWYDDPSRLHQSTLPLIVGRSRRRRYRTAAAIKLAHNTAISPVWMERASKCGHSPEKTKQKTSRQWHPWPPCPFVIFISADEKYEEVDAPWLPVECYQVFFPLRYVRELEVDRDRFIFPNNKSKFLITCHRPRC